MKTKESKKPTLEDIPMGKIPAYYSPSKDGDHYFVPLH